MERSLRLQRTGFATFFLSGICVISSGVIVSILRELYGLSFAAMGMLMSFMSIGNMLASFAAGVLPAKIGTKNTAAILCIGYFTGYLLMTASGALGLLMAAFLIIGIAKGCTLNTCTVLVGTNSPNKTRGMSIMHACYACGALICPFVISCLRSCGDRFPMIAIAAVGLVLWAVLLSAGLPGKTDQDETNKKKGFDFLKNRKFWMITALVFCQNAAETSVTGWLVTYYNDQQILSGTLSTYTVTIMWGATLIARLMIAFVFPVKNTFRTLTFMGLGCSVLYCAMMFAGTPAAAVVMLFAFAFSMAGVNPVSIAGTGKILSAESMGIMLPVAGTGAIIMPWLIGLVADAAGLHAGMLINLIPCIGIMVLSIMIRRMEKR